MTQLLLRVLLICGMVSLIGCGSKLPALKPYKMEIQQGNVITSKMLMKLRPGMTKSQVRYILGTPLILDSFHPNRWDYFYELRKQGKVINKRRVILDFQDNELMSVKGDVVPAEGDKVADAHVLKTPKSVAPPKLEETSWWDGLKFWKKDSEQVAKESVAEKEMLADEDAAIIKEAEMSGSAPAEMSDAKSSAVKAASKTVETVETASEIAEPVAAATAAAVAAESVVDAATPEVATPDATAPAITEAAEEAQSVLRKEIDIAPSTENVDAMPTEAVAEAVEPPSGEVIVDAAANQAAVADAVDAWASAWRNKDLDGYVASYVPTFKGKLRSRKSWLKQRDSRIAKRKGGIVVDIEDLDVVMDGNKATAYFFQQYRSATYQDAVTKRVDFVKNKNTGEWLIWRETTIPKHKRPAITKEVAPVIQAPVNNPTSNESNAEEPFESQERVGF